MPSNLYADLGMFRRRFVGSSTLDADDQTEILRALEAAARRVDEFCWRHFYALTATRVFDGDGTGELVIPDLLAATTIKLDEAGDRTFELTLNAATDYYLLNAYAQDQDSSPKTLLRLDSYNGQRSYFADLERLVQIAGRWGYTEAVERLAMTATLTDASTTSMTVSAAGDLGIGQTLRLEDEQVYISGGTASPFTVKRGVNGTTSALHTAVAVDRYTYVPEVVEAALIIAGRLWKRRETAYANVIANPVVGQFEVFRQSDPDVTALLGPLRRFEYAGVA